MKRLIFYFFLFFGFNSFSQQEVRLDIGDALAVRSLDISYEKYISDQTSIGISALFNFEGSSSDFRYNEDLMISPYLRHYFSDQNNWNFFGELFIGINSGESEEVINTITVINDYTDVALGIAIGTKYVSNSGLVIDIHGGLGRNMFGNDSPVLVPRVGIGIGYQF